MGQTLRTLLANVPEGITMAGGPPQFPIIAQSKFAEDVMGPAAQNVLGVSAGEHIFRSGIFRPDGVSLPPKEEVPLYRAILFRTSFATTVLLRPGSSRARSGQHRSDTRCRGTIVGGIGSCATSPSSGSCYALQLSQERYRATFERPLWAWRTSAWTAGGCRSRSVVPHDRSQRRSAEPHLPRHHPSRRHRDRRPIFLARNSCGSGG